MTLRNDARARKILRQLDAAALQAESLGRFALTYSRLLIAEDEYFNARKLLTDPRLLSAQPGLPIALQQALQSERGDLLALLGEDEAAIAEYVALSRSLQQPDAIRQAHEKIWLVLSRLPDQTLQRQAKDAPGMELKGWYQLAIAARQSFGDMRQQQQDINAWRSRWPAHPAIFFPPSNFDQIERAVAFLPQHVALLVPLTGNYGQAGTVIRNGVLAAYYDNLASGAQTPTLRIYDTTKQAITSTYQIALDNGADLVIGPLLKENLAELNRLEQLPAAIIGLNYLEPELAAPTSDSLFQFGLSIADEAGLIAERAWLEGRRSALAIAPDTGWGQKALEAFSADWLNRGGRLTVARPYTMDQSDFTGVVKPALLIDQSEIRAAKIQRTLGKKLDYNPRRRHDIDMVVMIAQPEQGRSIKPTLDFFYAHDLPIYATSHIYAGDNKDAVNRDLEGVRFSAMPWTLPGMVSEQLMPDSSLQSTYRHLYALGIDAYQLHQHVTVMRATPGAQYYGHTGMLTVAPGNIIKRSQPWAEFRGNKVRAIPAALAD